MRNMLEKKKFQDDVNRVIPSLESDEISEKVDENQPLEELKDPSHASEDDWSICSEHNCE